MQVRNALLSSLVIGGICALVPVAAPLAFADDIFGIANATSCSSSQSNPGGNAVCYSGTNSSNYVPFSLTALIAGTEHLGIPFNGSTAAQYLVSNDTTSSMFTLNYTGYVSDNNRKINCQTNGQYAGHAGCSVSGPLGTIFGGNLGSGNLPGNGVYGPVTSGPGPVDVRITFTGPAPGTTFLLTFASFSNGDYGTLTGSCYGSCQVASSCSAGSTTTVTGTVYAPNGVDPLPNVLVYIPGSTPGPLSQTVGCVTQSNQALGSPVTYTYSAMDGSFTLTNVPSGTNIPIVAQTGKWRIQGAIPTVTACTTQVAPVWATTLPSTQVLGDIPNIAIVTGNRDGAECVLRKAGVADWEFSDPTGVGRVDLYLGSGAAGAKIDASTPAESTLVSSPSTLNSYDMILFPDQGTNDTQASGTNLTNVLSWANAGGRLFAEHSTYGWLSTTMSGAATWAGGQANPTPVPAAATVSSSFLDAASFAGWLQESPINATTTLGQVSLSNVFLDQKGVVFPTQSWLTLNTNNTSGEPAYPVMQMTFNTPVGAAGSAQCGRVLFNDYDAEFSSGGLSGKAFPGECTSTVTAQDHLLEYALFDLSKGVVPVTTATASQSLVNAPTTFWQGDSADQISIVITNTGTVSLDSSLLVSGTLSTGITVNTSAFTSGGWSCTSGSGGSTFTCLRTATLGTGAVDTIYVPVAVASNAPTGSGSLTSMISGGGLAAVVNGTDRLTVTPRVGGTLSNLGAQPNYKPAAAVSNSSPADASSGLNLGADANYIFIDTGNTTLGWNAYQLNGNVLFGQGLTVQLSGGNNGGLGAGYTAYADSTANISGQLQNPVTFVSVNTSVTAAAAATAASVSTYASGLTATQTFSTINNGATINGNGGLNVINVGSINNANFTINGTANDYFVFNVSGKIQTNQVMTLTGGVTASHILWNLTGTGTVLQTSGGDALVGTFLATNGGAFQFSELALDGELINTSGNIQLVSGQQTLTQAGFTPPMTVACGAVTVGDVGVAFNSGAPSITGGKAPYTYSVVGTLPAGLTLNTSTGAVTGTPTATGSFQIKVSDSTGATSTGCPITINSALSVTCAAVNTGTVGVAFNSGPMTVSGGTAPYTYSVVGTLPAGLSLDSSTGAVTGTPTAAGTFSIKVTDAVGTTNSACAITISAPLSVTCASVTTGEVGVAFNSGPMTVSGGTAPYTYSVVGTLPAGLTLNSSTGAVTGTPTAAGTFSIKVTDSKGAISNTTCPITINPAVSLACATTTTGEVGVAFSATMTASGGVGPYTYSVATGTLPSGLTLNASTGAITGTPTAAGIFTIKATDSLGNIATTTCPITINPAVSLACATTTTGEVGVAFSATMTASGGIGPYTYSVATGALPSGLTLNASTGAITGTPTVAGTFTIKATDNLGNVATTTCPITINPAVSLACATTTTGEVGIPFSATMTASGGVGPYTYSVATGTLPSGLTLNASTGAITGTATAASTFTIQAKDSLGNVATTTCPITINAAVSLACATTTTGEVGVAFSATMTASGGVGPYTYSVATGTLPSGLTLNSSTGAITGTPTVAGTFTIQAKDSLGNVATTTCPITINAAISLACATTTTGEVGVGFSATMTASGGVGPYTYSVATGTLPSGLTLNASTGAITGTPTAAGTVTIKATDHLGNVATTTCPITINAAISLACATTTTGEVGVPFSATMTASGGVGPYTYSVATGTLPSGLTLNSSTGAITGTPTVAGTFTIQAKDSLGNVATTTCPITINAAISLACATTTTGEVGVAFSTTMTASGGVGPYTYSVGTGTLPSGLALNASTGAITGTPTAAGTFTIKATDSLGNVATTTCPITINLAVSLACATTTTGEVGVAFSATMTATGGVGPYTYSVATGTLPSGLTLNSSTGAITGTPTAAGTVTIKATDSLGNVATTTCPITINSAVSLACATTTTGEVGVPFSATMTASGGVGPYTYSVATGALPAGLTLNASTGAITGTPTAAGTVTIKATDSLGNVATTTCPITINSAVSLACATTTAGEVGVPFSATMTASGGVGPYTYSVATGALPAGLQLNASTGAITGTPTAAGMFTIKATDSKGNVATTTCPITITSGVTLACAATSTGKAGVWFSAQVTASGGVGPYTYSVATGTLPAGLTLNASTGLITGTPTAIGTFTIKATDSKGNVATATCPITINRGDTTGEISCWNPTFAYGYDYSCDANNDSGTFSGYMTYSYDGGAPVTVQMNALGHALFSIHLPVVGTHNVVVSYPTQGNWNGYTLPAQTFTVTPAVTQVSTNPSTYYANAGTVITFSVSLTSPSAGAPKSVGTVSFYDGSTFLATVAVDGNGMANYSTAALTVGYHTLNVKYSGGGNFGAATDSKTIQIGGSILSWGTPAAINYGTPLSATQLNATAMVTGTFVYSPAAGSTLAAGQQTLKVTFTPTDTTHYVVQIATVVLTVNKAPQTISFTTPLSGQVNSKVTLSATGGASGNPVTFTVTGPATLSVNILTLTGAGTVTVTANQAGNSNYLAATPVTQTIVVGSTTGTATVTLSTASTTLKYPASQNLVPCVTLSNHAAPAGTISLYDGTTLLTSQAANGSSCLYWWITPSLQVGTHTLKAVYNDAGNTNVTSAPLTVTVTRGDVTSQISCWNPTFAYGANYQCDAYNLTGTFSGYMTYSYDGGAAVTVQMNAAGHALFSISLPLVGTHHVIVTYPQQGNWNGYTLPAQMFVVAPALTQVALAPSAYYAASKTSIKFTVSLTSSTAGAPKSTGNVSFYDGTTLLGTAVVDANAQASYSTAVLTVGFHTIKAVYSGGGNFAAATASTSIQIAK